MYVETYPYLDRNGINIQSDKINVTTTKINKKEKQLIEVKFINPPRK